MERIVRLPDGKHLVCEGELMPDSWDVYVRRINGHVEISARQAVKWREAYEYTPPAPFDELALFEGEELAKRQAELERQEQERKEASQKRAARRAKQQCRLAIKAWGLNELLTLSYRENMTDREQCKRQFKEWVRRMKRALGSFFYVAAFEQQKRGAWHVHIATHKLPPSVDHKGVKLKAWQLGTAIWRSIVGRDNGMCFVGGKGGGVKRRCSTVGRLAQYVSKYITKDYANAPDESNRYSRSNGFTCPKSERIQLARVSLEELIPLVFELAPGHRIVSHILTIDRFSGAKYWLCTEPLPD